jgi:hypothetical protein
MKKNILLLFAITAIIYSCGNKDKKATTVTEKPEVKIDSTLITDSSWGLITKNTELAGLQAIYGTSNVKDERICGPECADSIDVTKIYSEKNNEFIVYWKDSLYHKSIAFIESYMPDGPYHTASGLKINSSLEDLLKINGKQITFSGFDWDYGGFIQSYNNGALEKSNINYHLNLTEDSDNSLLGDTELNTDMPEVKKMLGKILISYLSLSFNKTE